MQKQNNYDNLLLLAKIQSGASLAHMIMVDGIHYTKYGIGEREMVKIIDSTSSLTIKRIKQICAKNFGVSEDVFNGGINQKYRKHQMNFLALASIYNDATSWEIAEMLGYKLVTGTRAREDFYQRLKNQELDKKVHLAFNDLEDASNRRVQTSITSRWHNDYKGAGGPVAKENSYRKPRFKLFVNELGELCEN